MPEEMISWIYVLDQAVKNIRFSFALLFEYAEYKCSCVQTTVQAAGMEIEMPHSLLIC